MNKVESHDTGEKCNACGCDVTNTWGRVRCSNIFCITRSRENNLTWDSPKSKIAAARGDEEYDDADDGLEVVIKKEKDGYREVVVNGEPFMLHNGAEVVIDPEDGSYEVTEDEER